MLEIYELLHCGDKSVTYFQRCFSSSNLGKNKTHNTSVYDAFMGITAGDYILYYL